MQTAPSLPRCTFRPTACLLLLSALTGCAGLGARGAPPHPGAAAGPGDPALGAPRAVERPGGRDLSPAAAAQQAENARQNRARRAAALAEAATSPRADTTGPTWRERGSSNQAGRTQVTALSPDGQSLLIGTAGGGVFAGSPQAGWQARGDNLGFTAFSFGVRQLHASPAPETWLAAAYFDDVAVSLDRGATWSRPTGLPEDLVQIFRLAADGGDPRTVYLLAQPQIGQTQLFRSEDGGLHFTGLATFPSNAPYGGAVGDDLWTSRIASGPLYVLLGNGRLLRSTDRGATFSPVGQAGAGDTDQAVFAGSEAGAPTFYAFLGKDDGSWQVFASDDGGKSWEGRFSLDHIFYSGNSGIGTSTEDPNLVLFGGFVAYRSTDGGRTFAEISNGATYYSDPKHQLHVDVDGIQVFPWQGRESIFIDTDGGTWVSQDKGATFENVTLTGFPDSQYYSTLTDLQHPDSLLAGAQDQGIQISHPAAGIESFDQPQGGDVSNLISGSGDFRHVFAVSIGPDVLYWNAPFLGGRPINFPVPAKLHAFFSPLAVDPADPASCYVGGDRIWHLQHADRGPKAVLTQLPQDFSAGGSDYVNAFAISPADHRSWTVATRKGKLWSSHDGGATWSGPTPVAPGFFGQAVLPSTHDPRTVYVGGFGYDGTPVYRTTDGGATWVPMSSGLPPTSVSALAFDGPATENLYAATWDGPFRFDAASGTWMSIAGTQAPLTAYDGVEGVPSANLVRFATFGRGVWDYLPSGSSTPPPPPPPTHCAQDAHTLCLVKGRFLVRASWQNQFDGSGGDAGAIARSDEAGFFTFGDPANVELLVKVLPFDTGVKVFYGELTNLHFILTVTDLKTGSVKTYKNTEGDCGGIDQAAFPASSSGADRKRAAATAAGTAACRPGPTTLCLLHDRFALSVAWANPGNGMSGPAGAVRLPSDLTGAFFFTDPANLELVTKVLDFGDRVAVFYGALSDLDYTLTVTDTRSGQARTYHNPAGTFCGGLDNSAFPP